MTASPPAARKRTPGAGPVPQGSSDRSVTGERPRPGFLVPALYRDSQVAIRYMQYA